MRRPAVIGVAAVAVYLIQAQHHPVVLAEPAPSSPSPDCRTTDAMPPASPPGEDPPSGRVHPAKAMSEAFIRKFFPGALQKIKATDNYGEDGGARAGRQEQKGMDRDGCAEPALSTEHSGSGSRPAAAAAVAAAAAGRESKQHQERSSRDGSGAPPAGGVPAGSCVAATSSDAAPASPPPAAAGPRATVAAREFVVAATNLASAAVAATREAPESNASVEGGSDFDNAAAAGGPAGRIGGESSLRPSSSPDGREEQGGGEVPAVMQGSGLGSGSGSGSGSARRDRAGWRIGEGLAVPSEGAYARWSQLKEIFERKEAAGGDGRAYGGGEGAGAERKRAKSGEELVVEVLLEERREAVLAAIRWAWQGYTRYAWGKDELQPLTRRGKESFKLGLTIVDSMDTLWLAGEREEFDRCVDWVTDVMDLDVDQNVNVFETTIRVLGGLLAAYHLSGERALLLKAEDLGWRLSEAFDSPSGIPYSDVNLKSGLAFNPSSSPGSSLSEATTLQLEFGYLTQLTGNSLFHDVAQRASDAIEEARVELDWDEYKRGVGKQGLAPVFVDPEAGLFGESGGAVGMGAGLVTLGARGDSYYEYLLKQWLFSGKEETKYLRRYQEAVRAVEAKLLRRSHPDELWFVGEIVDDTFSAKMDHLVCFLPGTLALGYLQGAAGRAAEKHLNLARELMETCYQMYERTGTGLAPEIVHFNARDSLAGKGDDGDMVIKRRDRHNILRPEALESLYYLYWITREETYRDQAWAIFEAFEEHCRVDRGGYAGLEDVTDVRSKRINKMETFFLSESLKYLLLIFSEENPLPFHRYVLNTEAHAFPISQEGRSEAIA